MGNAMLRVRNLIKYFHDPTTFQVLKGLSFEVNKGEYLSLMGKSGAGKSTLLYILSTLDTDYEGSLEMNGSLLTGKTQSELTSFRNEHIGFIFQFHYLLSDFTILQNVMLPAMKLGKFPLLEIQDKAYRYLKLFDLEEHALKRIDRLSAGQQQRVAIARSMINDPVLILCDEPAGNLDSRNSLAIQEILKNLAKELGQTIVCVTHDADFAHQSDRIIELSDGLIRQ